MSSDAASAPKSNIINNVDQYFYHGRHAVRICRALISGVNNGAKSMMGRSFRNGDHDRPLMASLLLMCQSRPNHDVGDPLAGFILISSRPLRNARSILMPRIIFVAGNRYDELTNMARLENASSAMRMLIAHNKSALSQRHSCQSIMPFLYN